MSALREGVPVSSALCESSVCVWRKAQGGEQRSSVPASPSAPRETPSTSWFSDCVQWTPVHFAIQALLSTQLGTRRVHTVGSRQRRHPRARLPRRKPARWTLTAQPSLPVLCSVNDRSRALLHGRARSVCPLSHFADCPASLRRMVLRCVFLRGKGAFLGVGLNF